MFRVMRNVAVPIRHFSRHTRLAHSPPVRTRLLRPQTFPVRQRAFTSNMSQTNSQDRTSPFTAAAVSAMRKLYPESLADKSFDNTGLLLESTLNLTRRSPLQNKVLLCIDLTSAVADEAMEKGVSLVVAYHPIIFKGLKKITMADSQQRSLLRLAAEGISVYSPHTAVDAADGGNADWLLNMLCGRLSPAPQAPLPPPSDPTKPTTSNLARYHIDSPIHQAQPGSTSTRDEFLATPFPRIPVPSQSLEFSGPAGKRAPVIPASIQLQDHPNAGMGRFMRFSQRQSLFFLLSNLASNLGSPKGIQIALPYPGDSPKISEIVVETVAVCAGSGGGVFAQLGVGDGKGEYADLLLTGEMSHHEVLSATEKGQTVVLLGHSNSERGYLSMIMRRNLLDLLGDKWNGVDVVVSEVDRDPVGLLEWIGGAEAAV